MRNLEKTIFEIRLNLSAFLFYGKLLKHVLHNVLGHSYQNTPVSLYDTNPYTLFLVQSLNFFQLTT